MAPRRHNTRVSIPQSFIQELLARVDVVDIVGRYVQLRKGGANFMGLCPFHSEKSPSFTVSPSKQFYHCFGCGKNGNAIGFLMDHAGMGFVEAVQDLAGQVGLQVPQDDISPAERERQAAQKQKQATLTDVLEKAGESFRKHLKASPRPSNTSSAAVSRARPPGASAWATRPPAGATWPASLRITTIRSSKNRAWSSSARTTASATTASATG